MTLIIPITEFRKNIFALTEKVAQTGIEIEIEKEGKRIARLVAINDSPSAKAKHALTHVLPKLAEGWGKISEKEWKEMENFRRGKKEKLYWKRKIFKW
ncbi:type II toxin-antitoxin system Phd/YefM family antitoxin [Candidatus Roizmanbacteria bacterium]|nr:type II toxin-antitoxin system Phd/YefM family antitoxin [Candidatus Roizmanbacteria bacterium]